MIFLFVLSLLTSASGRPPCVPGHLMKCVPWDPADELFSAAGHGAGVSGVSCVHPASRAGPDAHVVSTGRFPQEPGVGRCCPLAVMPLTHVHSESGSSGRIYHFCQEAGLTHPSNFSPEVPSSGHMPTGGTLIFKGGGGSSRVSYVQ